METVTKSLIGVCIVLVVSIIIILILYFRSTPNTYKKHKNKVDQEIENELKKKH